MIYISYVLCIFVYLLLVAYSSIEFRNVVYLYFRARVFYNIILGALVVASNHWVLIGSNDLHRFWDVCYVGHADNIKKHLWFRHIVTSNVSHGYVILIARIDGAMRRKTQSVSQLDTHISLREMRSFAYSPLSGIPDSLRTWIFDPRQVSTSTS